MRVEFYWRKIFDARAIFFEKNIFHALQFYPFLYLYDYDAFRAVFLHKNNNYFNQNVLLPIMHIFLYARSSGNVVNLIVSIIGIN